jgi:hypothetical protein
VRIRILLGGSRYGSSLRFQCASLPGLRERLVDDPLSRRPHGRLSLRGRAALLPIECCVAVAFVTLAVTSYDSETKTSFVPQHGLRVSGDVQTAKVHENCDRSPGGPCYLLTRVIGRLSTPTDGVRIVDISYGYLVQLHAGQHVRLRLDPTDPRYAELAGQPRSPGGIWIAALLLAAAAIAVALVDGRSVLHLSRARSLAPTGNLTPRDNAGHPATRTVAQIPAKAAWQPVSPAVGLVVRTCARCMFESRGIWTRQTLWSWSRD